MTAPQIRATLEEAIRSYPVAVADALSSVQLGASGSRIDFDGLHAAAELVGRSDDFEAFAIEQISARKLVRPFLLALAAREVPLAAGWEALLASTDAPLHESLGNDAVAPSEVALAAAAAEDGQWEDEEGDTDAMLIRSNLKDIGKFEERALGFRCRIWVDDTIAGSGFLAGPATVMTAWHVVAAAENAQTPRVEVQFADGQRIPAFVPVDPVSKCSDRELANRLPANDAEVAELHDVAVLTLKRPVGAALGIARLSDDPKIRTSDTAIIAHFPGGSDFGLGFGVFRKLRGLTSRWGHTVQTRGGSSGAACLDSSYRVVGLHQGKVGETRRGRLVPVGRFPAAILQRVARDEAPPTIWSLDGTVEGPLVIGRQDFFRGFAEASRDRTRVRGIRIKRVDAATDPSGIPFSFLMLEQMVARSIDTEVLRISFESIVPDLADEMMRRAREAGMEIGDIAPLDGVAAGQSSAEAVATDRGRRAATALDACAAARARRLWIFLEHPSALFSDMLRVSLEGFVDQALRSPQLRLVVAGYEAVSIPGLEFTATVSLGDEGLPGLVVEYIEGFRQSDVEVLIRRAAAASGVEPGNELVAYQARNALNGLPSINGVHPPWSAHAAAEALRPALRLTANGAVAHGAGEVEANHG